jgi:hypothetical protein
VGKHRYGDSLGSGHMCEVNCGITYVCVKGIVGYPVCVCEKDCGISLVCVCVCL